MEETEHTDIEAEESRLIPEKSPESAYDLGEIRKARGITLQDIFLVSRVSVVNLEAIERGQYHLLPTPFIAKSFIRTYAKAVGLDAEAIVRHYEASLQTGESTSGSEESVLLKQPEPLKRNIKVIAAAVLAALVIGIIVAILYAFYPFSHESSVIKSDKPAEKTAEMVNLARPETASAVSDQMQTPGEAPVDAKRPQQLTIEASGYSWIKITEDRKPPFEILLKPGEKIERSASEYFEIDIGNAGATNVIFQGKPLGNLGRQGEVVHLRLPSVKTNPIP